MTDPTSQTLLPHPLPNCADSRTLLIAMRRMAIHGLRDAVAANLLLGQFGLGAQKVGTLLRAMLTDIALAAQGNVVIAPCCVPRMTPHERLMLLAIADPDRSAEPLLELTSSADCLRPVVATRTLAGALAEMGRPVRL